MINNIDIDNIIYIDNIDNIDNIDDKYTLCNHIIYNSYVIEFLLYRV